MGVCLIPKVQGAVEEIYLVSGSRSTELGKCSRPAPIVNAPVSMRNDFKVYTFSFGWGIYLRPTTEPMRTRNRFVSFLADVSIFGRLIPVALKLFLIFAPALTKRKVLGLSTHRNCLDQS